MWCIVVNTVDQITVNQWLNLIVGATRPKAKWWDAGIRDPVWRTDVPSVRSTVVGEESVRLVMIFPGWGQCSDCPSVLWRWYWASREGIRHVKNLFDFRGSILEQVEEIREGTRLRLENCCLKRSRWWWINGSKDGIYKHRMNVTKPTAWFSPNLQYFTT